MHATFLTSWNERCGISEYSKRLVEALQREIEVDVVPATFRRSPKAVYAAMGQALNGGEVAHVQHSYAFFGGMHPFRSGWKALADRVSRPMLLTVHELDERATGAFHLPAPLELAYKRGFNRSVFLHRAARRWMVHAAALKEALERLGAPPERVLYRPLPLALPEREVDPAPLRRKLRLEGKRPLVMLGFLSRRKGYDLALQALRELNPEYVLVAAGGEHAADTSGTRAWLQEEAEQRGVGDRLRITGYLSEDELEAATGLAELVLAPFHEMSASASLNYALARRKGVVASDLPENRRLACLRLFRAGDASALAAAVRELGGDRQARRNLEQAAGRYAQAHSYQALAEETVRLYAELQAESRS